MEQTINANDKRFASEVHSRFSSKSGSERIATKFALAHLSAVLNKYKPMDVIEYGAGIGTVTYALLSHPVGIKKLTTTEQNDFCLA